jgi:ABC-type polysaccharide/polyol phosphate export permease
MSETLPYITTGIIFWSLLTSCLTEGTQVFISAESFIRNIPQPVSLHFYRMVTRNLFIWLFNMVIYLLVVTIFKVSLGWSTMLFLPGFALFLINVIWMALASAILSTRYRDIPQVISNAIQVVFYVTPIFWSPGGLSNRPAFIDLNPFNHLLAIVRIPLLGGSPQAQSWLFCIAMAIVGVSITLGLYSRAHARIAYWV